MPNAKLRPLEMNDLDNIMSWVNDEEVVGKFSNIKPMTREKEKKFLEKIVASETDKVFAIEDEKGVYLGNIGIHEIDWKSRIGRLAIIIGNKAYWGKGYAQSAIKETQKLMFNEHNFHKIWLIVMEENQKGRHIYSKSGFRFEGLLRDEYYSNGKYHNMVRMSILKKEYNGGKQK